MYERYMKTPGSPPPSTSGVQLHPSTPEISVRYSPNLAKRMQEEECYVCHQQGHWSWSCPLKSINTKTPGSPSPSTSRVQLHPSTPEISVYCSPNLAKRMQGDTCYECRQRGHWSWYCPLKSLNTKKAPSHSHPNTSPRLPPIMILCRCGHGFCNIKHSNSDRNRGRKYYTCPIKRGEKCKVFVKWCDDRVDDSDLQPPAFKYPECECGAGVCRRVKGTENTDHALKYYFVCPVKRDHGSCGYRVSEDELLNRESIVPMRQGRQRSLLEFFEGHQNDKTDSDMVVTDLGEEDGLLVQTKKMRIMDSSENPLSIAVSDIPEKKDAGAAVIDKPMENSLTIEKHNKLFEEEKMRFSQLRDNYVKTEALIDASNHHKQLLCEQISNLKAMLHEKQEQLKYHELETLKIENNLGDLKRSMLVADITLKERAEQSEIARKRSEERRAKQIAAKASLKAKLELEK